MIMQKAQGKLMGLARSARRAGLALVLCGLPLGADLLAVPGKLRAQGISAEASEEKIKAAYLYKFLNYVEWPANSPAAVAAPYRIGIVGDEPVVEELLRITAGKTVRNRPLAIRRVAPGESPADIDVLFIGRSERARQASLLRQLRGRPVLTVTETDGALAQGSMVNFRIIDDRVRFEVSLEAAEHSGLKLSAGLLGIATNVVKGSR